MGKSGVKSIIAILPVLPKFRENFQSLKQNTQRKLAIPTQLNLSQSSILTLNYLRRMSSVPFLFLFVNIYNIKQFQSIREG